MKPQSINKIIRRILVLVVFVGLFYTGFRVANVSAATGIYRTINFQGKIVNKSDGTNIGTNNYNFTFKLYDAVSGGNQLPSGTPWSETQNLPVTDGIFKATIGASTPFPANLDFNSDSLYLDITFNGETFGSRVRLTAVPYAFNAEKVNGLTVTATTGTLTIPSGKTIAFSGANDVTLTSGGTTTLTLPATGTLATLAGSEEFTNKTIGSTGLTFSGAATDITTVSNQDLAIVPNGSGMVGIGTTATTAMLTVKGNATASGDMTMGGQLQLGRFASDPTQVGVGAMYYNTNTNKFKCYINNAWADCDTNTTTPSWSSLIAPTGNLAFNMYQSVGTSFSTSFTYGNATSTTNLFNITDTASNNGTGYLFNLTTATSSTLKPFHVSSAGTEAILVNAAGNIGLGNLNPLAKLDVTGAASFSGTLTLGNGAGTGTIQSSYGPLVFNYKSGLNSYTAAMLVDDITGYIGLGLTAPTQKLDVAGNATASGDVTMGGQLQVGRFGADPSASDIGAMYYSTTTNKFRCRVNSGWVDCDVNTVGSPVWSTLTAAQANLSLNMYQSVGTSFSTTFTYGNATGATNLFNITDTALNTGTGYLFNLSTQTGSTLKPFYVSAAGTGALLVDATGNVGVGSLNPGAKLDVVGSATVSGNLTFTGVASTIANRAMNGLTIGDTQTGNIYLKPKGGSSGGIVQIGGGSGGSTTPSLLLLDMMSTGTIDPTVATNGAMYYNEQMDKFRCRENGAWKNCDTTGDALVRMTADQASAQSNTTLQNVTELKFTMAAYSTYFVQGSIDMDMANSTADGSYSFTIPAGATISMQTIGWTAAVAFTPCNISASGTRCDISSNAGVRERISVQGFVTTGATSGDLQFQIAQRSSTAVSYPVAKTGSYFTVTNIVNAGGADLAEQYYTRDQNIIPGTVVSLDPQVEAGIMKSTMQYDRNVLGVVSTKPGLVLTGDQPEGMIPILVALSGRVPVKVSTESGSIDPGDYLTTSSLPGIAMRATKAGPVIGQALTGWSGEGIGEVTVFVKNTFTNGDFWAKTGMSSTTMDGRQILSQLVEGTVSVADPATGADISELYTDRVIAGMDVVAPHIVAELIDANGLVIGGTATGSAAVIIDSHGNASFSGTLTADTIRANHIEGLEINGQVATMAAALDNMDSLGKRVASLEARLSAGSSSSAPESSASGQMTSAGLKFDAKLLAFDGMTVLGKTNLDDLFVTGNMQIGLLAVNGFDPSVSATGGASLALAAGALQFRAQDGLVFASKSLFNNDVEFAGHVAFNRDAAGYAVIKQGDDRVKIAFTKPYEKTPVVNISIVTLKSDGPDGQPVIVTPADPDVAYAVSGLDENGFTIVIDKNAAKDVRFAWTAVLVKEPETFMSQGEATPTPTPSSD